MSAADKILGRLQRVKQTAYDKWAAACPLCQSKNGRPIAVRDMPDGRVLLHAFCGCDTGDVLNTLGLKLTDLFPERLGDFTPVRRPFDAIQVLEAIAHEIRVAVIVASDIADAGWIDAEQASRLHLVAQRLNGALEAIGEGAVPDEIKRIRRAAA